MALSPSADVEISESLVRALLVERAPELAAAPLTFSGAGWDNEQWRIGDAHVVRLPRRTVAANLIRHEHAALPFVAQRVRAIETPTLVVAGAPEAVFPFAWSVLTWIPGVRGTDVAPRERLGWAARLAAGFAELHVASALELPNPVRGVPLVARDAAMRERLGLLPPEVRDVLGSAWQRGLAAAPHSGAGVLCHGDPHPGNVVANADGSLRALIDFGDVTIGDPAVDYATAWLTFDEAGFDAFRNATGLDDALWARAGAWAAIMASAMLLASDDSPELAAVATHTLGMLTARPD